METIIALIPAYQAAAHVGPVVSDAERHLPVVVIDDGSTDDTAQVAEAAGAVVLRQVPNQGKGAALVAGFEYALRRGSNAVLMLDADGQHDPHEIPKFLAAFHARHADLVIGARDFSQMPLVRRLSNTVGARAFSWAIGQPIRDNQSGYRLLSRRMIEAMLESRERGFEFEMDMILVCVKRGWPLEWVPIRTIYGDEESHIKPVAHVVQFFRMVRQTRQRMRTPE